MTRASYFGTRKVNAQIILKGICINLLKAANKIFIDTTSSWGAIRPKTA
jgi:IS5 family transposase